MNKNLTEIIFLLDCSGSMCGLENDTINGYNGFLNKQMQIAGETLVTTVLFGSRHTVLHDRVKVKNINFLTEKDYKTGGRTALMDAVGDTVLKIGKIHGELKEEERPGKTIVCIITDGLENASTHYSKEDIKCIITEASTEASWEFVFFGANIDAATEAESYGISKNMAVEYCNDSDGIINNFVMMDGIMKHVRRGYSKEYSQAVLAKVLRELQFKYSC